ncbi:MAG: quinohemoprotein ethanol dehydrogenase [Myxococcota bacterium]|jgi:quinohemoprotein ethanol dehydrogenase
MKRLDWTTVLIGFAVLGLWSCANAPQNEPTQKPAPQIANKPIAAVDSARLTDADSEPGSWMSYGRTYSEQRFSPLEKVTDANAKDLGLAWSHNLDTRRGIEATSIVVDGVMYLTSSWSIVTALDARTGKELWTFDPAVKKEKAKHTCCDVVNRGVAAWQGQVFVGALDGRLIALDAATGTVNWEVATFDPKLPYTITGAPRVIKGKVLIGSGGAEFGVRGFIGAYEVDTGELAWRFYTVPGDPSLGFENDAMKLAAETWNGEWWKLGGGGGTVWDAMAYDPELDLLYIGVGNGTPWNREIRSPGGGDNLFLSSIVALRPDTGEYVWHYQTTPGESWDYTATQHIILADMELDGVERKVLMQAPKNGFFYVIDRIDGTLLSAENYIQVTWATHVDMETGRPVETPGARYTDGTFLAYPSYLGGHNWHPMSYNPETGLVYIPVLDIPAAYAQPESFEYRPDYVNLGTDGVIGGLPDAQAERDAMRPLVAGRLVAWDPKTQKEVWRVEHKGAWNGGTLSTAGNLVFQGTADGKFVAFTADKGEAVWEFPTQTGVVAPAMTYEMDGEQYVSVNVGWGGAFALVFGEFIQDESLPNVSRVLTFKLGANKQLPEPNWRPKVTFNPPAQTAAPETIAEGLRLYQDVCMGCHGLNGVSGLLVPDLRGSALIHDAGAWRDVVRGGILRAKGMASFATEVDDNEAEALRAYIIAQAIRGQKVRQGRQAP